MHVDVCRARRRGTEDLARALVLARIVPISVGGEVLPTGDEAHGQHHGGESERDGVDSELPAFGQLLHLAILGVDILLASNHYRSLFTALELTVSAADAGSVIRQR